VELRDVLPTFLDAGGLGGAEDMDGKSLLPLLAGNTQGWRPHIDLEHDICYGKENHWSAVTDGVVKYIFDAFSGGEMLFDLSRDPGECVNLAVRPEQADLLAEWRGRLVDHLRERGDAWVKDGQLQRRPESILHSPHYPG